MKTLNVVMLAAMLAATPACKKKKDDPVTPPEGSGAMGSSNMGSAPTPDQGSAGMGSAGSAGEGSAGSAAMGSAGSAGEGSAAGSAAAVDPNADYISVLAEHKEKKPTDPVEVKFEKYSVVKASFDPKKIEGGTATIELDLTSLKSGSDKRDAHLQSPDYLNVPKFAKATIDISNVKKGKAENQYTATAKVKAVGVNKTYPVTFEVLETTDDSVRIKGEHAFKRTDFKVGKDPKDDKESVAGDLTIKMQLTLKKT